jgi:hypothetical protein
MDKRYQVFVSSTFQDLQVERQEVMQALLELDCIPSGMELFPAANEDQWALIKKVIDDCDYYVVIIGGRYGSLGADGLSYTEMEYRYAIERGKPVIGFFHRDPGTLAANRCESLPENVEKLEQFRALVKKKVCRPWDSPSDLGSQVSRSLVKLIKSHPAIGWVRADLIPAAGTAEEILRLKRRIEELQTTIAQSRTAAPEGTADLAQGEDTVLVGYTFRARQLNEYEWEDYSDNSEFTWNQVFAAVAPKMIREATEYEIRTAVNALLVDSEVQVNAPEFARHEFESFRIKERDFQTIVVQLRALGLIIASTKQRSLKDTQAYWTLTPYGDTIMTHLRAQRKTKGEDYNDSERAS